MSKESTVNSNIESICANYSFMNMSIGDIERIKTELRKYKALDNGLIYLKKDIDTYIKYYEKQIEDCKMKVNTMKRFLKESDYESFFMKDIE